MKESEIMLRLNPFVYFSYIIERNNMTSGLENASFTSIQNSAVSSDESEEKNTTSLIRAWVWQEYYSELPQTLAEAVELSNLPIPMAWTWCYYRGELTQTAEEKIQANQLARKENIVLIIRKPAKIYPSQIAASLAAGFMATILVGQAVAMSVL